MKSARVLSQRLLLAVVASLRLIGSIADTSGQDNVILNAATVNTLTPPGQNAQRAVVGAYYYPWYGFDDATAEKKWRRVLRRRLVPPQSPVLGTYRSDDPGVIAEHLKQSRRAGLSFWAVSWWGPGTATDRAFRESLLPHPNAQNFRFAVLYESTGRLGEFRNPNYENWLPDMSYLAEHYFLQPNYLRVNDRPVVFIYLSRVYFRNQGQEALAECRELHPEVYLVGDDVFGGRYQPQWARQFDAVTIYDVYGQSTRIHGATSTAVKRLAANYATARAVANSVGTAFIPTVAPGYNDSAVRAGHPGTARYLTDQPESREGDLFRAMLRDAALPNLDDRTGRMMMVTSFNEWYEDTQIEATRGEASPTTLDDSPSGRALTNGVRYEDYGTLYLDILWESLLDNDGEP